MISYSVLPAIGWAYLVMGVLLLVSVVFLLRQLRHKRDQYVNNIDQKAVFDREIRTLIIILVIFDIGYLFRFVYDIKFADNLE